MDIRQESFIVASDFPRQMECLHKDRIDQFLLLCKPLDMKGVILLDPSLARIFNNCDGSSNIKNIAKLVGTSEEKVIEVIFALWGAGFIRVEGKKSVAASEQAQSSPSLESWLHVTNNCNLECSYCYVHKTKGLMTWETAQRAIDSLVETALLNHRSKILIKLAGGEPLLRFEFIKKVVDYGKKHGEKKSIDVRFHLITNGTLVSAESASFIKANNLSVSISLDGVGAYNDRQRFFPNHQGSFSFVDRGIKTLIACGVSPFVLATVTSLSLPGLPELTHYLLDNGVGSRFSLYRDLAQGGSIENINLETAIDTLSRCYDVFEEKLPEKDLVNFHQLCDLKFVKKRKRNCGAGSSGIVIGHEGQVSICQALLDQPVGDIYSSNLIKVVRGQNQYIADENSVDDNPECRDCIWRYICAGGCPLLTKAEYGIFKKRSPYCNVFQFCIPRLIRIMGLQMIKKMQSRNSG